jgi:hypothetical protein
MRHIVLSSLLVAVSLGVFTGCGPSAPPPVPPPAAPTPLTPDTVLRVHWVGKKRLGIAASAYSLMRLWDAPQTKPLERQLLAQLATAPWRLTGLEANAVTSSTLSPLLDDVVREESFLEVRAAANGPAAVVFALRLNDAGAERWRVNGPVVLQSLTGVYPSSRAGGWTLVNPRSPVRWEFSRVGQWVVIGAGPERNVAFAETVSRIQRDGFPFAATPADHWLAADVDLRWLAAQLETPAATANLPRVSFVVTGDGEKALTTGEAVFAQPHGLELEPWRIPADKLGTNCVGFTAVRGVRPWITGTAPWQAGALAQPPNQFFTWADRHAPMQMHLLAPDAGAKAFGDSLGTLLATAGNAWIKTSGGGNFARVPEVNGVVWEQLPIITPYLRVSGTGDQTLVSGGLIPQPVPATNAVADIYPRPSLTELIADLNSRSNVVAYSWETTGERIEAWLFVTQVLRVATRHAQMPADTASSQWLQTSRPRLGNALTVVTAPAPDRLAFTRESTVGFTALELHLLANWMESPQFPRGTHAGLTPNAPAP